MLQSLWSKAAAVMVLALLLSMVPVSATTIDFTIGGSPCTYSLNAGLCSNVTGAHLITFDGQAGTPLPYTNGLATYTLTSGSGSPFVNGNLSGQYAKPPGDETDYLTVGSGGRPGEVTIDFAAPIQYFGLYLGSPDSYNALKFYQGQSLISVQGPTGQSSDWFAPGNGDQSIGQYVNFNVHGGGIDRIVMSSSQAAFETDNHAYAAVPEPSSLALIGLGLAGLYGYTSRRRKV